MQDYVPDPIPKRIRYNGVIFTVRSRVTLIDIGTERTKINIEGRDRNFYFLGQTRIKSGDYVELQYILKYVKNYTQAWVLRIRRIVPIIREHPVKN